MNLAVIGATGLVGRCFLDLIEERSFPYQSIKLFASAKTPYPTLSFQGKKHTLRVLRKDSFNGVDLAFFSAGLEVSKKWAPVAKKSGTVVVDNSSAFRMKKNIPLIVPEINGSVLKRLLGKRGHLKSKHWNFKSYKPGIISNPNCSTIQMVLALAPLKKAYGIQSLSVSTYQALSGAGKGALMAMSRQSGEVLKPLFAKKKVADNYLNLFKQKHNCHFKASGKDKNKWEVPFAFNSIPKIGDIENTGLYRGYSKEERKMIEETQKILGLKTLSMSVTCVRVPVFNGHALAMEVELKKGASQADIVQALEEQQGLSVIKNKHYFPHQKRVSGQDSVFVGRIRPKYETLKSNAGKNWLMWVVADNLRKGAALNSIQIAECLLGKI